jgi:hypothetical protein
MLNITLNTSNTIRGRIGSRNAGKPYNKRHFWREIRIPTAMLTN